METEEEWARRGDEEEVGKVPGQVFCCCLERLDGVCEAHLACVDVFCDGGSVA